ncbi:DUF5664 domain-containing protein [Kribbella sp. NBC_01505]|uniref:dATP/dGTP diphosphohydrolase domain-containing protein n=1 Tax=Kribbella sp. NBC_01505 TaxID=2903580 RepID=UPI003867074A
MIKETRVTNTSGGQKGAKIHRFDQIPAGPMFELAARFGVGSLKYEQVNGVDNWRNGYDFSLSLGALERHLYAFKNGDDYDPQAYIDAGLIEDDEDPVYDENGNVRPGVTHLSAVIWHCMFMLHHLEHNPHFDNRASTVLRRNAGLPVFDVVRTQRFGGLD